MYVQRVDFRAIRGDEANNQDQQAFLIERFALFDSNGNVVKELTDVTPDPPEGGNESENEFDSAVVASSGEVKGWLATMEGESSNTFNTEIFPPFYTFRSGGAVGYDVDDGEPTPYKRFDFECTFELPTYYLPRIGLEITSECSSV